MRRIGLIGGISWSATAVYYRLLNQLVAEALGPDHSIDMMLRSLDFSRLRALVHDVPAVERIFADTAAELVAAGAERIAIASLTGHRYASPLTAMGDRFIALPQACRIELAMRNHRRIGLLATSYVYGDETLLASVVPDGCRLVLPEPESWEKLDSLIFDNLAVGREDTTSVGAIDNVIAGLATAGADAILLGTTDFSAIATRLTTHLPLFDATSIHATALLAAAKA